MILGFILKVRVCKNSFNIDRAGYRCWWDKKKEKRRRRKGKENHRNSRPLSLRWMGFVHWDFRQAFTWLGITKVTKSVFLNNKRLNTTRLKSVHEIGCRILFWINCSYLLSRRFATFTVAVRWLSCWFRCITIIHCKCISWSPVFKILQHLSRRKGPIWA